MNRGIKGQPKTHRQSDGFTLVELMTVVVIMSIIMGVLAISISRMQGPATRVAAAQVASGLSLARQVAIARNTEARFVISPNRGDTALPEDPWVYWCVVYSNKEAGNNLWVLEKDWERLPAGAVFLNIAGATYSTINWDPIGAAVGQPFAPQVAQGSAGNEWRFFSSYGDMRISYPAQPNEPRATWSRFPYIGYKSTGVVSPAAGASLGTARAFGLRVADGTVTPDGQILLRSTNNAFYIETDMTLGRVRVRPREDYR